MIRRRLRARRALGGAAVGGWIGLGIAAVWLGLWLLRWQAQDLAGRLEQHRRAPEVPAPSQVRSSLTSTGTGS